MFRGIIIIRIGLMFVRAEGFVVDKYMFGGCGLYTTYRQVGQSSNYSWIVGRNRNGGYSCLFFHRFLLLFSVDFQERHRQTPDVNKGVQIICDKQIVSAKELFAD